MLTFKEIHLQFKNCRTEKDLPGIGKVWSYLAQRGISKETADSLGLFIMPAMDLIAAARRSPNIRTDSRAAVIFPHYSVADGEAIDWWSSRLVDINEPKPRMVASFGDLIDPERRKRPGKMFCPPNEFPHGYLCPLNDWVSLPAGERIYIHESCIKSTNGALLGKYSIGLNGVWGWMSRKHEISLIEEIKGIPWKARKLIPVIVFDSNVESNWLVQEAESRLAAKLYDITGQQAIALRVPKRGDGEDQGFDDFRASAGDAAALALLEGEGHIVDVAPLELMRIRLNSEVCVVRDLARIAEQATGNLMTRATFTDVNYAHYMVDVATGEAGAQEFRRVSVPKIWLTDDRRVEVQSLDYMPGQPTIFKAHGESYMNLWRGMGCEPEQGDVDPWMELLAHNVEDEWLRNWIISWLAYPLQNPGVKMTSLLLLFGPSGVGKGLFLAPFRHIYGANAVTISNEQLKSQFNSIYANKQLVHIDELKRVRGDQEDSASAVQQKIKLLCSDDKMVVNTKGQPEYRTKNCSQLALTSNYHDCIKLDQDDRRACVVKWSPLSDEDDHRGDQPYWINYVKWMESYGPAALYQFLLEWDCGGFDPHAWAPSTPWKVDVTESSMAPMELWMKDLWNHPDEILPLISTGRSLWTAKELAVLYYAHKDDPTAGQVKAITNALRNQGFQQANGGHPLKPQGRDGVQARYWVIQERGDKSWYLTPSEVGSKSSRGGNRCVEHLKQFM